MIRKPPYVSFGFILSSPLSVERLFGSLEVVAVEPFADRDEQQDGGERYEHVPHPESPVFVAHRSAIIALMVAVVRAIAMS